MKTIVTGRWYTNVTTSLQALKSEFPDLKSCVWWINVNDSGPYSGGHPESVMLHEHRSDSRRWPRYDHLQLKIIWILRGTPGSLIRLAATKIRFIEASPGYCAFIHRIFYVSRTWVSGNQVRWLQWPVLRTTITNPSVWDMRFQPLYHVLTEMWGDPSRWKYTCNRLCVCVDQIMFNFSPQSRSRRETDSGSQLWLGMASEIKIWSVGMKSLGVLCILLP